MLRRSKQQRISSFAQRDDLYFMAKSWKIWTIPAATLMLLLPLGMGQSARASVIYVMSTTSSPAGGGGPVNVEADFTIGYGKIAVTLINYLENLTADSQLISGISFGISGASGSGGLTTSNNGIISTISVGGSYSAGVADTLTGWKASETGLSIELTTIGDGAPNHLIIGPDNADGFVGAGTYSAANGSITKNHNPSDLGSATFDISIPGVTTTSTLSNVVFQFGTAGTVTVTAQKSAIPEPQTIAMLGFALAGLGLIRRRQAG
jgi:PEP-CTERM motif